MGFFQFLSGKSKKIESLISEGLANLNARNYTEAIASFDEVIRMDPRNATAYYNLGNAKRKVGKKEDALKDYDKAIYLDSGNAEAYGNRALIKHQLGRLEEAMEDYNRSINLSPEYAVTYNNRGNARYNLRKYEDAIADYGEAIRLKQGYSRAHYNRGKSLMKIGRREEAIQDFDEAIKLEPDNTKAYYHRGCAKSILGRHEDAIKDMSTAIDRKLRIPDAFYKRGISRSKLGLKDDSLLDFSEVIKLEPKNAKAYYNRANINFNLNRYEEALTDYNSAIHRDPNLVWAYYGRSTARIAMGKKEKAIQDLERFLQLTENSPSEDSGLRDEALNYLELLKSGSAEEIKTEGKPPQTPSIDRMEASMDQANSVRKTESAIKNITFEAILYIDICNSTVIIDSFGEMHFSKMLAALKPPLEKYKQDYECGYNKSTGDGWMLTFEKCVNAVNFGVSILKATKEYNDGAPENLKIDMRIGIDCGQVLIREDLDRCGDAANVAKRIEGLTKDTFVELSGNVADDFPIDNRIFISTKVLTMIRGHAGIHYRDVGWAELKGKPGIRFQIFEVLWKECSPASSLDSSISAVDT